MSGADSGRVVETIFTIWVAYSAYANLVEHRITRLGFDGLIISLIGLMAGNAISQQARADPRVVKRMAIMMLLVTIGGVWDIVGFVIEHVRF